MVWGNHYATALGELALRAAPQVVRKARQSFPSSSMASASRHWMSLSWACWVDWALEALLDSASLMVVEQQFSTCARAREQSSLISLRQVASWTLALLISAVWQVSKSQMGVSTEGLCFLDSLGSVKLNLMEGHAKVRDLLPPSSI